MSIFTDQVIPNLLSMVDLPRLRPAYIAQAAIQPVTQHDFQKGHGKEVEVNRDKFWGDRAMTKGARRAAKGKPIGTPGSSTLEKSITKIRIEEYIGPVDDTTGENIVAPLVVTEEDILYARRNLWIGNLPGFQQSIGGNSLADDYQRFVDRALLINELALTTSSYNPGGIADGSVAGTEKASVADLLEIEQRLASFNTQRFQDGFYHVLCDHRYLKHLRQDADFKEDQRAMLQGQVYAGMGDQSLTVTGAQAPLQTPSGMMMMAPAAPVKYGGFMFFVSNNIPARTVNSRSAGLAYFFGPGSIAMATGGPGGMVRVAVNKNDDYGRIYPYIWKTFTNSQNLIPPAGEDNAGVVVEARTFAS
jgi:hypothetical protein